MESERRILPGSHGNIIIQGGELEQKSMRRVSHPRTGESFVLSKLLEEEANGQANNDELIICVNLLMESKNITHLKSLLQNPKFPRKIKLLICDLLIEERCFEVNGLIGDSLMEHIQAILYVS